MIHPIMVRGRIGIYLVAWIPAEILVAVLAVLSNPRPWLEALALAVPMTGVYALMCLSAWFVCRSAPLRTTSVSRLVLVQSVAALLTSGIWALFGKPWAALLSSIPAFSSAAERYARDLPLFFVVGVLLFLLAAAGHYLVIAFEESREAERRALELQVLAREAELKSLLSQINPHFLFNSLNSISALAGSDAAGARRMCLLLADFLRTSLRLGARDEIALSDELTLIAGFLAIEQVRFGARLAVEQSIEDEAGRCAVPPLLLQPLVENAVSHGIAGLVEGGVVRITARLVEGRLEVVVENPRAAPGAASPRRGEGVGLRNVAARLTALHGGQGKMETERSDDSFRVTLRLPARRATADLPAPAASAAGGGARPAAGAGGGGAGVVRGPSRVRARALARPS